MARQVRKAPGNRAGYQPPKGWQVERVQVPSTKLFEFGHNWLGWGDEVIDVDFLAGTDYTGCIAKVLPPAGTPESQVAQLETLLYERGAKMVRVLPTEQQERVQVLQQQQAAPKRSLRQVALDRAARVTNPRDRDALISLVNDAMDQGES